MSLFVKNEGGNYSPVPEGTHLARCVQIIDLGHQYSEFYDKWSDKVMIRFELPNELIEVDGEQMPRIIGSTYTKSLSEKANLRGMLEGWRGKKFTEEELQGFNLAVLIGLPCMVTVTHRQSNGKTYADIAGVVAPMKGLEAPEQMTESLIFDIDDFDALNEIDRLPEFIQNMIRKSREWQTVTAAGEFSEEDMPDGDLPF